MKLSRASGYALEALVAIAGQEAGAPVTSHTIAEERGLPEKFLPKVLLSLVNAKILLSLAGPNGGYRLAKPAADITLLEVIEAVDGPIRGFAIQLEGKDGQQLDRKVQAVCQKAADQVRGRLQAVSLADLAGKRPSRK
jgi:Rrf2 family protein